MLVVLQPASQPLNARRHGGQCWYETGAEVEGQRAAGCIIRPASAMEALPPLTRWRYDVRKGDGGFATIMPPLQHIPSRYAYASKEMAGYWSFAPVILQQRGSRHDRSSEGTTNDGMEHAAKFAGHVCRGDMP